MKRNTIAEMRQILDAIEQGKPIQWYNATKDKWDDTTNKRPNFCDSTYRIKPEKKWRPFKDTEELFAHNNGSNILWLKRGKSKMLVTEYTDFRVTIDGAIMSMGELLRYFTFTDCTPCGVEEDA